MRKNALMVLTHLILNDMIKVKNHIYKLAICIVDADDRIAGLAKLFFFKLSRKVRACRHCTHSHLFCCCE